MARATAFLINVRSNQVKVPVRFYKQTPLAAEAPEGKMLVYRLKSCAQRG